MLFPGHPEIYPLLLTTKTQEIFNCQIDEDITDEQPYILIKKEAIFADFENRGAISDFHPVKKIIQVSLTSLFIFQSYLKRFLVHNNKSWRDFLDQNWHSPISSGVCYYTSFEILFDDPLWKVNSYQWLFYSTYRKAHPCPPLTGIGIYPYFFHTALIIYWFVSEHATEHNTK